MRPRTVIPCRWRMASCRRAGPPFQCVPVMSLLVLLEQGARSSAARARFGLLVSRCGCARRRRAQCRCARLAGRGRVDLAHPGRHRAHLHRAMPARCPHDARVPHALAARLFADIALEYHNDAAASLSTTQAECTGRSASQPPARASRAINPFASTFSKLPRRRAMSDPSIAAARLQVTGMTCHLAGPLPATRRCSDRPGFDRLDR